jgi:SAM-dependent methyltransferase
VVLPDGRRLDLRYFVNWRPYLWAPSVAHALKFLGDLRGKRVLEVGGGDGRIACLFALLGAQVTMVDTRLRPEARTEVAKWKVENRVRLVEADSALAGIEGESYDAVFTKSVLWFIEDLGAFLGIIDAHLAPGGKVAFVENYRGGGFVRWFRRHIVHRGKWIWERRYLGVRRDQIPLFQARFANVTVRRPRLFVFEIFGYKGNSYPASESEEGALLGADTRKDVG